MTSESRSDSEDASGEERGRGATESSLEDERGAERPVSDDPRGPEEPETTQDPSKTVSGERSDPGPSEPPRGSEDASGEERSDPGDAEPSETASEPPTDPASDPSGDDGEGDDGESDVGEGDIGESDEDENGGEGDDGEGDVVPLDIAGHEGRDPPNAAEETVLSFGDDGADGSAAAESEADEDADEEVEPVELLVQLAKDGEIDPWDIDVVRVTDKFLAALDEPDIRTSGRALFYASVLLRMKSDELFAPDEPEEAELPPWEAPFADEESDGAVPGVDPIESLEAEMERRLDRKHARGTPETLDELVRELRDAERGSPWKSSRSYDTSDSPSGFARGMQELHYHSDDDLRVDDEPTAEDVTHTTHAEDIDAVIDDVEAALEDQYEKGRDEVLYAEIEAAGGSRVMTYLALLFLAHRGHVRLEQDELFGDLWVQRVVPEAEPTEALAD